METWITPKAKKKPSEVHGEGLFAVEDIEKDEIVVVKDGHILTTEEVEGFPAKNLHPELQIAVNLFIGPRSEEELEDSMAYVNHSCDPNLGMRGDIVVVAMRDIEKGEELTHDYATIDNRDYEFECGCQAEQCRGTVTGRDWQKEELQEKYEGYFSAYIQSLIDS